jgi:ribosomal protein S18 acetylase RimI-like enzyme
MADATLRRPAAREAGAVAALVDQLAAAVGGPPDTTAEHATAWWAGDRVDPVVAEQDGEVVGFGDLYTRSDHVRLDVGGRPQAPLLHELEQPVLPAGIALSQARPGEAPTFHRVHEETGWIHVVAVRRPWRGRELGSALLRASFRALAACGMRRAMLGVDAENTTGAVRLYERGGMRVAHRFETWERQL